MANTQVYNLEFKANVGTQNRVQINPYIANLANLKQGDQITLKITQVTHKEA